jgi:hypothetical protein
MAKHNLIHAYNTFNFSKGSSDIVIPLKFTFLLQRDGNGFCDLSEIWDKYLDEVDFSKE